MGFFLQILQMCDYMVGCFARILEHCYKELVTLLSYEFGFCHVSWFLFRLVGSNGGFGVKL